MVGRKKLEGPGVNYFEIPRRQLQSLCKKYGFPANRTNQLMAEFLTCHLNSDEYLNRDKSLPSPAVKTRFQCRDDEPATDDNLPTISESQETVAGATVRSLSQEFMNVDVTQSDSPLETPKPEGTGLGEATQNGSQDMAGGAGSAFEEAKDFTASGFRIREYKTKSVQDTPLQSTTEAVSMDCERQGSSRGSPTGSDQPSSPEEGMDVLTTDLRIRNSPHESENPQGQETPLPLSIMPYVRPFTPDSTLSHSGLKLFVDLENDDGLPFVENMTKYYGAWGAQIPSRANTTMQDEFTLGGPKTCRPGLKSHRDDGLTGTERAAEDREMKNFLLQASISSTSSKEIDCAPLKSCLVTPNRKASALSVSFLCPEPKFSSPSVNGVTPDAAERSEIVKEWRAADEILETCQGVDDTSCAEEQTAANGELLLQKLDGELRVKEPSELNIRPPQSTADLESPPEGIVEKLVKICEERSPSTVQAASQRKESYKASPFLKSSRIAAELERASKLGQARRVGILALKRAMGVAPLFSDFPDVQKEPLISESSTDIIVGIDAVLEHNHVLSPGSKPIQVERIQDAGVSRGDIDIETPSLRSSEEPPVGGGVLQSEGILQLAEDIVDKGEQISGQMEIDCHKPQEREVQVAEEAVKLPATVEESVTNLSWMNKPIQLPTRTPASHKLKEKPGRPFSANGRKLELMERASAKLKMLKKNTAGRGEAAPSRPKTILTTAGTEGLEPQGRAGQVEPPASRSSTPEETPIPNLEKAAETSSLMKEAVNNSSPEKIPIARLEKAADNSSREGTPSQLNTVDDWRRRTEEGISFIVEDNARIHNGTMIIATDQELNVHEEPVTIAPVSIAWEGSLKSEENAKEEPAAALSFLDIDFTKIMVPQNVVEVPEPKSVLEIDCPTIRERMTTERSTPLSPLNSNRRAIDAVVDISQNPTTPTKPSSILDFLSETEERNGLSSYNKENEWSRRLEQHKTPLTGRSKEKALRTAEKKASSLREQLLRKRRGLIEGVVDSEDSQVQVIELSPIKKLATSRML